MPLRKKSEKYCIFITIHDIIILSDRCETDALKTD